MDLKSLDLAKISIDPYSFYRSLSENGPIFFDPNSSGWYVASYEDITALLQDKRLSSRRVNFIFRNMSEEHRQELKTLHDFLHRWALYSDAPQHPPLRRFLLRSFTADNVASLQESIEGIVSDLLDEVDGCQTFDAIECLAYPLPVHVMANILGFDAKDREKVKGWSDSVSEFLETKTTPDENHQTQKNILALADYIQGNLENADEQNSLIHKMFEWRQHKDEFTTIDIVSNLILVLSAGYETTANLIGNGLYTLLQHPEQIVAIQRDFSLLDGAVEEVLRFEPPVQLMSRTVKESFSYKDHTFEQGQRIVMLLAAAGRDDKRYLNPDLFDIGRKQEDHLAFGFGIHSCIGNHLARLETKIVWRQVLSRFPNLSLAEQPEWKPALALRGLKGLEVRVA